MLRRTLLATPPILALAARPAAAAPMPRVVVELFTSQSCSSCPPADALLGTLAPRPDLLVLSYHVTYWNRLGWRDRFSLEEATQRQRSYAATLGHRQIYTPQTVVQGQRDAVGSNRAGVLAAIQAATPASVALQVAAEAAGVSVAVGAGHGTGDLWLIGFDARHVTPIGGGENAGRTLSHTHVVRSLARLGGWDGQAQTHRAARPQGEQVAVLLQATQGPILASATP
jgi:hypothetical protein